MSPLDYKYPGLTIRDYFAGMSMQGMLSNHDNESKTQDQLAEWAYADADAMLKERKKSCQDEKQD